MLSAGATIRGAVRVMPLALVLLLRSASSAEASSLAPLRGEWLEPLGDLGFVSPPTGATGPRPIVVAVHGAGDRPDWSCSEWRAIFGPEPFVVCPQGVAHGRDAFAWPSVAHLERAIDRAVEATRGRWPEHALVDAPRVYAGFSQGAVLGRDVVARAPARYPFVVFLEGLGDVASASFSKPFAKDGKRLLLACSRAGCAASRETAKRALGRAGIDARVVDAGPIGHVVDARVIGALRPHVPWLLAGWRGHSKSE